MADTVIVGKFVGTGALAAVGSTGTVMFLILGFVLVLTAASMAGMKPLLEFMHTPEDIFSDAYAYIMIICAGICAQTSLNLLGSLQVAAFTAASKIEQVVTQAYVAMGTTMATYCAQNMGAGKVPRIRQGFKAATIMGSIYAVVTAAVVMTVGKYMTYLFVSGNVAELMGQVDIYLKCVGIFFIPLAIVNIYRNGIQGMGYGVLPMLAGVAGLLLIGMYYYVIRDVSRKL